MFSITQYYITIILQLMVECMLALNHFLEVCIHYDHVDVQLTSNHESLTHAQFHFPAIQYHSHWMHRIFKHTRRYKHMLSTVCEYGITLFCVFPQLLHGQLVVSSTVRQGRRLFAGEGYSLLTMPARDDRVTQEASGARLPQAFLSLHEPPHAPISLFPC